MSELPMRGHFRYRRFKTFPTTPRTSQCEVFCPLLSSSQHSGVPEDSQPPTFPSVGLHPHTWPKWGCDNWGVLYIIGNLLKCRCRKWLCIGHLDIYCTSYGKEKGRKSNCQFDFRPLKVKNRHDPSACRWSATHLWKALEEGYKFAWDLIPIRGLSKELWSLKVPGVQTKIISGLFLGSPKTKNHSDVGAAKRRRIYYMGEGGGSPRVRAVVSKVSPKLLVACLSTKGVLECELINLLVGLMQVQMSE